MIGPRARRAAVRLPVPRTPRARLIAGLLALLLLTCGGVAPAATDALRHFLVDRLDQQLSDTSGRYATARAGPGMTGAAPA